MAFVGYIESVSNLATSEIRSMWLSGLLDKKFELPSVEKMLSQTLHEMDVMKRSTRFYKRHCNSTHSINHNDEMCEDMGWSSWRKKNWITEGFSPYSFDVVFVGFWGLGGVDDLELLCEWEKASILDPKSHHFLPFFISKQVH
ncbi:hypothetical protein JHK87_042630 [Glycine soja]|nr:hypothetical protein JHK87_042630 [Glycine soja]